LFVVLIERTGLSVVAVAVLIGVMLWVTHQEPGIIKKRLLDRMIRKGA